MVKNQMISIIFLLESLISIWKLIHSITNQYGLKHTAIKFRFGNSGNLFLLRLPASTAQVHDGFQKYFADAIFSKCFLRIRH